ncbi:hypothetical protein [Corynebacterium sp. HMSC034A01]|uniref:hypothetical protein n=1 Tax=Corynebacterium sp. HMSC034A01 TaxID=1739295 RepID=UPI001FEF23C2|nr:hypothetical protein [Corynebacterium sp. HMSC034A01]
MSLGTPRTETPGHQPRYEARADRFTARALISPVEYTLAERTYGAPARFTSELCVTVHMIRTWRAMHQTKTPA